MKKSIVQIKNEIKELKNMTEADKKVLAVVDSFWGCPHDYIKANLICDIAKYRGCEAWKIVMNAVYL